MNKTAIRATAVAILAGTLATRKKNPIGFNLGPFFSAPGLNGQNYYPDQTGHNCNSVACVAGWAHFIHGGKSTNSSFICQNATKILGLTDKEADELFAPENIDDRRAVTQQQAALVLFNLAETGKVDWKVTV